MIKEFRGPNRFLSNFHPALVVYEGIIYPTTEHAYQAAKTLDEGWRYEISAQTTPGKAKRLGRQAPLRADWEKVKLGVMLEIVRLKFSPPHFSLIDQLLATGEELLVEGNTWGDTFWGVCRGRGENHLGEILMQVRDELRSKQQEG